MTGYGRSLGLLQKFSYFQWLTSLVNLPGRSDQNNQPSLSSD